jgi:hypothetical protein
LAQGGSFGLLLRLAHQRRVRLPVFEQTLREVVQGLEALGEQDRDRWLELLSYVEALIYNERDKPEQEPLIVKVADTVQNDVRRQEVYDMGQTMAEFLIEKGRQEEKVQSRRQMLLRLLRNRFGKPPAAVAKRIAATDQLKMLEKWFDRASSADNLDAVGIITE